MTVREQIIRKSIKLLESKIKKINDIITGSPYTELFEHHKKVASEIDRLIELKKFDEAKIYLAESEKETIRINKAIKKQENTDALIDKQIALQAELEDLQRELRFVRQS
jgi:Iap family predicted aminopeptidase